MTIAGRSARRGPFDLRVILVMWRRELLRYRGDRSQIFGGVSRTLLWLVILGFGLGATLKEIEGFAGLLPALFLPNNYTRDVPSLSFKDLLVRAQAAGVLTAVKSSVLGKGG